MQQSYKLLAISHWLLDTRITEETLPHLPIPSFGGANALNDTSGFKVCKVLLYRFCRDAHLVGKRNGTQLAIFGKQGNDFLPTFYGFLPTFLCKVNVFSLLFIGFSLLF